MNRCLMPPNLAVRAAAFGDAAWKGLIILLHGGWIAFVPTANQPSGKAHGVQQWTSKSADGYKKICTVSQKA